MKRRPTRPSSESVATLRAAPAAAPTSAEPAPQPAPQSPSPSGHPIALVVIGASQGGVQAVAKLLRQLPREFATPIAVTLHRERSADSFLAHVLGRGLPFEVVEATDKTPLLPQHVFVAPADYHLLVERGHLALSTEPPVRYSRPSIDVMFETAAESYGPALAAVVLTGANDDGARGAVAVAARHGVVLVQSPASAENPTMPQATLDAVPSARSGTLATLGAWIAGTASPAATSQ